MTLPTTHDGRPLFLSPAASPLVPRPVRRLLVANRGEIALRIIRTATQLGIETVAVYASVDAAAPHVKEATQAVCLGPVVPADAATPPPYMNPDLLIQSALNTECDALHPGYGYLSENADFADRVAATPLPGGGYLRFVGPRGEVMREMGDKASSKRLLKSRMGDQAPVVPGYEGKDQSDETLVKEGKRVGFPLMVKASAGGGGRGMRIVWEEKELPNDISRARSEAQRSFSSPTLLLERYVAGGKHIEVQIFGDNYGQVVAIGERECSVQRRHQKVIEECPSPSFDGDQELRRRLHASAVKITELLSYSGAATLEYIYSPETKEFFFLEINTRLQVEHPVTEMVYGLDLVSLQLYVAGGGRLADVRQVMSASPSGHAIELRICAEEPGADFAPRTGLVRHLSFPFASHPGYRLDSGVVTGTDVSIHFDAMLAKNIIHGPDRTSCIARTLGALHTTPILGVVTNTAFLSACLSHPTFADGTYSTALITEYGAKLLERTSLLARPFFSASTTSDSGVPVRLVVPAFLFFFALRRHLSPARAGLRPAWQLHDQDHALRRTEVYEVHLPDGAGSFDVVLEYAPSEPTEAEGSGTAFDLKLWTNTGDAAEKTTLQTQKDRLAAKAAKKGSEAKAPGALPLPAQRTGAVARYYGARASRIGAEGREDSPQAWKHGVAQEAMQSVRAILHTSELALQQSAVMSGGAPARWINGTLSTSVDGRTATHVMASDDGFEQHEQTAQTAWLWVPALAGQVRFVRRGLRVWAGRADTKTAGGAGDDTTYTTPMPCRVLQVLSREGAQLQPGDPILVMESMKTEVTVRARAAGTLRLLVAEGASVGEGQALCRVELDE